MKVCSICGKEIVNGINGCQLMPDCFECHGGLPDYSRQKASHNGTANWDELDTLEDKCVRDYDD